MRRADTIEAERLAREAVALADATDSLDLRAGTLVALGEVLAEAGRNEEAAASVDEARALYALKGNVAAVEAAETALSSMT
jgi:hypothetical protein